MAGPDFMAQLDPVERRTLDLMRPDEDRAMMLLDAEYRKEQMHNMAREGLQGGFFNRRDKAAVRAIVAAMKEARDRA
jgi:hypothetical protein